MTFMREESEVLKVDARGRVRVSRERRDALLDEYERSGMSGLKFARLAGINYGTFAGWWSRRRKERAALVCKVSDGAEAAAGRGVQLVEAILPDQSDAPRRSGGLQIDLPGGARLQVDSPIQLRLAAELLALLNQGGRRPC